LNFARTFLFAGGGVCGMFGLSKEPQAASESPHEPGKRLEKRVDFQSKIFIVIRSKRVRVEKSLSVLNSNRSKCSL
jgi:hypothetical protein